MNKIIKKFKDYFKPSIKDMEQVDKFVKAHEQRLKELQKEARSDERNKNKTLSSNF
tara:strand:+ start:164 stop:331 length:168 start_codon:yes stop_codon:yes gene_type:complete